MMKRAVTEPIARAGHDKFSFSYFAWVALIFLLFASGHDLDRIFNLYLLLVPLIFIPAIAVLVYWTIALIWNAVLRRWRRVFSVLVAPVAAYLLFVGADAAGVNSARIRFEIGRHHYLDQIAKLPQTDEPHFKSFDWGQTGGAGVPNIFHTLVYDESDEILLPSQERSAAWRDRANRQCPGMCSILRPESGVSIIVKKIVGHFYLVTEAI
jgi:hypothetical protein